MSIQKSSKQDSCCSCSKKHETQEHEIQVLKAPIPKTQRLSIIGPFKKQISNKNHKYLSQNQGNRNNLDSVININYVAGQKNSQRNNPFHIRNSQKSLEINSSQSGQSMNFQMPQGDTSIWNIKKKLNKKKKQNSQKKQNKIFNLERIMGCTSQTFEQKQIRDDLVKKFMSQKKIGPSRDSCQNQYSELANQNSEIYNLNNFNRSSFTVQNFKDQNEFQQKFRNDKIQLQYLEQIHIESSQSSERKIPEKRQMFDFRNLNQLYQKSSYSQKRQKPKPIKNKQNKKEKQKQFQSIKLSPRIKSNVPKQQTQQRQTQPEQKKSKFKTYAKSINKIYDENLKKKQEQLQKNQDRINRLLETHYEQQKTQKSSQLQESNPFESRYEKSLNAAALQIDLIPSQQNFNNPNESKEILINILSIDKDSFSSEQLNKNQNDFNELDYNTCQQKKQNSKFQQLNDQDQSFEIDRLKKQTAGFQDLLYQNSDSQDFGNSSSSIPDEISDKNQNILKNNQNKKKFIKRKDLGSYRKIYS